MTFLAEKVSLTNVTYTICKGLVKVTFNSHILNLNGPHVQYLQVIKGIISCSVLDDASNQCVTQEHKRYLPYICGGTYIKSETNCRG